MQVRNSIFYKCWQHAFAVPTPTHLYPLVLNPSSMMLQGNCGSMRIWTKPCTEKTQLWHWWRPERGCHWRSGLAGKRYRSSTSTGHAVNSSSSSIVRFVSGHDHDGWVEVWPAVSSLLLPLWEWVNSKNEKLLSTYGGKCKIQTNLNLHLSLLSFEEFVLPQQRRRIQICTFSRFSKWDVTEELVLFRASPAKYQPRVRRSGVQHTRSINRLGHRTKGQGTEWIE